MGTPQLPELQEAFQLQSFILYTFMSIITGLLYIIYNSFRNWKTTTDKKFEILEDKFEEFKDESFVKFERLITDNTKLQEKTTDVLHSLDKRLDERGHFQESFQKSYEERKKLISETLRVHADLIDKHDKALIKHELDIEILKRQKGVRGGKQA